MELTDYLHILRENWLIIVLATLLGVGAAAGYSLTRTPMYEAQSTVFVSTQAGGTIGELQQGSTCLLYTSPSPRDKRQSRMPSSA